MISAEIAVSGYILPPPELPKIPPLVEIPSGQLRDLAIMSRSIAVARELLKVQSDKFEAFFELILNRAHITAEEIERMAESLMAGQHAGGKNIIAAVETLDRSLPTLQQSKNPYMSGPVLRVAEEGIDIGKTWLVLYQNLHVRLMKLASDRRGQTEQGSPVFSDSRAAEAYLRNVLAE